LPITESLEPPRPELDFTLVRNGMDYLSSAVLYLTGSITVPEEAAQLWPEARAASPWPQRWLSDRHLKYGVLHLQAATEVLLKARLVREHWSLVFKDPGSATRSAYEQGKFESCGMKSALDRLVSIAGLSITQKERGYLNDLAETRNALTHYGHTASAYAVEARAARALSFLVEFVPRQLQPKLSSEAEEVIETMAAVREKLADIRTLVGERMKKLASQLEPVSERTVICASCRQMTLVVGENPLNCRFCLRSYASHMDAAFTYWEEVLQGDDSLGPRNCPACRNHIAVLLVSTRADPLIDVALCFQCGTVFHEKKS
jgi:hypothetical protein